MTISLFIADKSKIDVNADWKRVDVSGIWQSELLPLLQENHDLQMALERTVASWTRNSFHERNYKLKKNPWRFNDPDAVPPFMLTFSDGAYNDVQSEIEKALDVGDDMAHCHMSIINLLCNDDELGMPKSVKKYLEKKIEDIERKFWPTRKDVRWVRPLHSCHNWDDFTLLLAIYWRPEAGWKILSGDLHTTIISEKEKLIFDLLLLEEKDPAEPIRFALKEKPVKEAA
jgi:hypothetical protein